MLHLAVGENAIVRVQNPVRLSDYSEPVPDIALLRPRADFYKSPHPGPQDVLLIIEIADTARRYDQTIEAPLYARHGTGRILGRRHRAAEVDRYRESDDVAYARIDRSHRRAARRSPVSYVDLSCESEFDPKYDEQSQRQTPP